MRISKNLSQINQYLAQICLVYPFVQSLANYIWRDRQGKTRSRQIFFLRKKLSEMRGKAIAFLVEWRSLLD
ncbi:MAG: hypothetical protein SAJ37_07070 [Oscillatoria sp. PMC 1068.18]|nr:hypothetical protein [Oscillatoria sp. PMC 1076.18]MEC4988493.1 hypothetical protein [Oscillatoria sp. PMC 1068.18]